MENIKKINDNDLAQVSGGKQDPKNYVYETTVNKEGLQLMPQF